MKASDHISYCQTGLRDLKETFYDIDGEVISPVMSHAYCTDDSKETDVVYCHPKDESERNTSEFEYPHFEV